MKTVIKSVALILCVMIAFPTFSSGVVSASGASVSFDYDTASAAGAIVPSCAPFGRGDVNTDGKISIKDVLLLKKYIAGTPAETDPDCADVDGNGAVNAPDLVLLKKVITCSDVPSDEPIPTAVREFDDASSSAKITAMRCPSSFDIPFPSSVNASRYKYAVISYRHPAQSAASATVSFPTGTNASFALAASSDSAQKILDFSNDALWSGAVPSMTVGTDLARGDILYVEYVAFAEDAAEAERVVALHNGEITDDPMRMLIFDNAETTSLISAVNNTRVSYNGAQSAAKLTVSGSNSDPQTAISYDDSALSADDYKYITITYMVPSSVTATKAELFLCAGSITSPTADARKEFTLTKDGVYHYAVIPLSGESYWTGDINLIRFDYVMQCAVGDTVYVDSICLSETNADANAIGYERLALRGAAGGVFNADTLLNGTAATVSYFGASSMSGGTCTFSGHTMVLINGAHESFNRFCFEYSTNAIVRGVAYYTCGGVERADEFFLENTGGQTATFRSLILDYFNGAYAADLRSIDLYTINTSSASVKISGITEEDYTQYSQTTYYITGSNFKLGIDLLMGGGVIRQPSQQLRRGSPRSAVLLRYRQGSLRARLVGRSLLAVQPRTGRRQGQQHLARRRL